MIISKDKYNNRTAVDIFCGAGGMSLGATLSGITPVLAIDSDCYATQTFKKNHKQTTVLCQDIRAINPINFIEKSPFILIGGPPCQGFSIANTRTRNIQNPNNSMFKEYLRFVKILKPNWFIFENVSGFRSFNNGFMAEYVETSLAKLGYKTSSSILDASDYGVPQNRNRFFIIGNRIDDKNIFFDFNSIPKIAKKVTVRQAIGDLPSLKNGDHYESLSYKSMKPSKYASIMRKNSMKATQNYVSKNSDYVIERYKVIKEGDNWQAALKYGYLDSYSSTKNTHSGIYKRLERGKPSVTIANYRKSMLIHPIEDRGLSLREAARLQSFPDDFLFCGLLSYMQQQVGNAVPPLLAKAIFDRIIHLSG